MTDYWNEHRTVLLLFFTHLITRSIFVLIVGFDNNFNHQPDSFELVKMADDLIAGDWSFSWERFIVSPLFPVVCAGFKLLFGTGWAAALTVFQVVLAAVSGVYLYRLAILLLGNARTALLASLLFAVFPLTLWFVHTFSQESLFQSLLIITIYHLVKAIRTNQIEHLVLAAVLFSITYHIKSHILLFAPFIPLLLYRSGNINAWLVRSFLFASICVLSGIPFGLHQLKVNDTFVFSSNGAGFQFYMGNSEMGYRTIVDVPKKGTEAAWQMKQPDAVGYFNDIDRFKEIMALPQAEKQKECFREGVAWIRANPGKATELKLYNTFFFLMPGVSFRHYDLKPWLLSFLLSFPLYLAAYSGLLIQLRHDPKRARPILYLFLSMLIFSVVFYVQNRFRTITLEPSFYCIYAVAGIQAWFRDDHFIGRLAGRLGRYYGVTG